MKTAKLYPTPHGITTNPAELREAAEWIMEWAEDEDNSARMTYEVEDSDGRLTGGWKISADDVGLGHGNSGRGWQSFDVSADGSPIMLGDDTKPAIFATEAEARAFADELNEAILDGWIKDMNTLAIEVDEEIAQQVEARTARSHWGDGTLAIVEWIDDEGEELASGCHKYNLTQRDPVTGEEMEAFGAALRELEKELEKEMKKQEATP